jgi:hypothetical protein
MPNQVAFRWSTRVVTRYGSSVFDVLEQLQLGDHAALFYQSKADQLACALPYIAIGLKRNERCVYLLLIIPRYGMSTLLINSKTAQTIPLRTSPPIIPAKTSNLRLRKFGMAVALDGERGWPLGQPPAVQLSDYNFSRTFSRVNQDGSVFLLRNVPLQANAPCQLLLRAARLVGLTAISNFKPQFEIRQSLRLAPLKEITESHVLASREP